ncbi:MAG: AzlC family ABC transporter permease [Coriobacteriia bacterium]|nr:AzlC family ABC transporter permease [Coriobacteriia bacterium]
MSRRNQSMIAGARDVAPILLGIVPFGLVAGAAVIQAGFGLAEAVGMSLFVNAGASQIVATTLFGEGAPLFVVLGTALVVNARMFIYSTSIAPVLADASPRLRPLLGHMLVDQNYATTMTRGRFREDVDVVAYYIGCWLALASVWQLSSIAGALLGSFIPTSWQLDFAVPLVFLALLAPTLKDRLSITVAVVTGISAAILVPIMPMQTGLLVAMLIGMITGAAFHGPETEEER